MHKSRWAVFIGGMALIVGSVACGETDAGITAAVKTKLAADDTVKAYQINVDTREKVVTLTGTVETDAAKTQAVRLTRETAGVTNVVDNIVVSPKTAGPAMPDIAPAVRDAASDAATATTDAGITAAVKAKLLGDPDVAGLKIDVDTQKGVVTLTGTVKTAAEKAEAIRLARETAGVTSVSDKITVGS